MRSLGCSPQKQASNPPATFFFFPCIQFYPFACQGIGAELLGALITQETVAARQRTTENPSRGTMPTRAFAFQLVSYLEQQIPRPYHNCASDWQVCLVYWARTKKTTSPTTCDLSASTGKWSILFLGCPAVRLFIPCCIEIFFFFYELWALNDPELFT